MRIGFWAMLALTFGQSVFASEVSPTIPLDSDRFFIGANNPVSEVDHQTPKAHKDAETPAAVSNGGSYGVIAPLYLYSDPLSLIRFVNGGTTAATFSISLVGSPSGTVFGTATINVPSGAALQKSIGDILTAANATPLASDSTYSFYVQSSEPAAGYQHIIFSNSSGFLENVSVCRYPFNTTFSAVADAQAVISVHTSVLADNAYPSQIELHNYASTAVNYQIAVVNALTGQVEGVGTFSAAANSSYLIPFVSGIQEPLGWVPEPDEIHANVVVMNPSGGAPAVTLGHTIVNTRQTNTVLNMGTICAVNAPPSSGTGGGSGTSVSNPSFVKSSISGNFEGWDGDSVFTLANGQVWQQSSAGFKTTFRFNPQAIIFANGSVHKLAVEGVDSWISVRRLVCADNLSGSCAGGPIGTSPAHLVSNISGSFSGWTGSTQVTLTNGQVWRQSGLGLEIGIAFQPQVVIYEDGVGYKMAVEGFDNFVGVVRVQ